MQHNIFLHMYFPCNCPRNQDPEILKDSMKLPHALSRLYATPPQETATFLTLSPSSFANESIFRRAQFYKDKGEKDENNTILEAENQMDE